MNPILQKLNPTRTSNSVLSRISQLQKVTNGDAQAAAQMIRQQYPEFDNFLQRNSGKSAIQIAQENGIDPTILNGFLR